MCFGGHTAATILYIAIYSAIFTMVKPYTHHGEDTSAADPSLSSLHPKMYVFIDMVITRLKNGPQT